VRAWNSAIQNANGIFIIAAFTHAAANCSINIAKCSHVRCQCMSIGLQPCHSRLSLRHRGSAQRVLRPLIVRPHRFVDRTLKLGVSGASAVAVVVYSRTIGAPLRVLSLLMLGVARLQLGSGVCASRRRR
jgi:hypothetical protein